MWERADTDDVRLRDRFVLPVDRLTIAAAALGAIVTVVIAATPSLTFGFRSPSGHLVLDSIDACVATLLAYLVYGRFLRYRRLQDLLLAQGLALLAVAGLVLSYVTEWVTGSTPARCPTTSSAAGDFGTLSRPSF